ncbi:uncharacterized protein LOC128894970 [Hylaeus anthracinus]|uniref:uncharacterized protein LOC128894970 n=1 Tax=Hylaeus anthracinus TaxID=313031 RepID=UPI0023B97FCC|nr:uncharacterized protein LOC128894970 [Hylaeus anthracinus]XP_054013099.1 uncharacterized protein LOC128894970 [Hylaeus anthracinus]
MDPLNRTMATSSRPLPSRHRLTMASCDFTFSQGGVSRNSENSENSENPEGNDAELDLLYNEYLQLMMIEVILKKKMEKKEKQFSSQLAKITEEIDGNEQILFKLKTRKRDIEYLTKLQNDIDSQIINVKKYINSDDITKLQDTLSQLYSLLQRFDVLLCEDIVLPETPKEQMETMQTLKSCVKILQSIMDIIKSQNDTYQSVNNGLKDFLHTHDTIEDYHNRLGKVICKLQTLVLKTVSMSLVQTHK